MKTQSKEPIAVLISDIHFTVPTLKSATRSLFAAFDCAKTLNVQLIICGDTLDSKAIMRAECVNSLIDIFKSNKHTQSHILVGNHDLLNERGAEHSLNFLKPYTNVVDTSQHIFGLTLIPYQSDIERFKVWVKGTPGTSFVICHQGFLGAQMGHYVTDKTSVDPQEFKGRRIISGHYHKRHDVPGTNVSYLGNPYTLSFGEAHDGPKGFNILYSDGSLELVPLDLPKHVIVERTPFTVYDPIEGLKPQDKLMIKVTGTEYQLRSLNKEEIGIQHLGHSNFRLDLIPTTTEQETKEVAVELTESELLDSLIEELDGTEDYKSDLKNTWRELVK